MNIKTFINLSVKNLDASVAFFTALGFVFDPAVTDRKVACMIVSESTYVMLLTKEYFATFIEKEICNCAQCAEVIVALRVDSKEEADRIFIQAVSAGAKPLQAAGRETGMHIRAFEDLDGHAWEIFH